MGGKIEMGKDLWMEEGEGKRVGNKDWGNWKDWG